MQTTEIIPSIKIGNQFATSHGIIERFSNNLLCERLKVNFTGETIRSK